ncbi:hypothetical protein CYQ88_06225 [Hydrogenovibrio sp. SC-1]|uniref:TolC family protein n=1 Tax=Hydrogenovibrio sp. SC-1 TaxID=2065820 RepID=UPI000C7CAEAC|nr:TolC family protein [Hydrogenovibrio sp. SC-1]PLA74474.1 hypothetical protein CYQ88_06225 [Hydrogenovibrio sp. SC-1]
MTFLNRLACLGVLTVITSWVHASDTPNSLTQIFKLALEHNPTLTAAVATTAAAKQVVATQSAQQGTEVHLNSELSYAWMAEAQFPRSATQLVASYPLYQPQKQAFTTVAQKQHQATIWQQEADSQSVLMQVAHWYFKIWQQKETLYFLQKEQTAIAGILQQVQQRFQVGYQDLTDVSDIQSRLDFNRAETLKARQQLNQSYAGLNALLGGQLTANTLKQLQFPKQLPANLAQIEHSVRQQLLQKNDQAWAFLTQQHPKIQALDQQWQASENRATALRQQDHIQLKAFGALVLNESDGHFYDDMRGAKGGVQLSMPLYLGGQTQSKVSQQRQLSQQKLAQKTQFSLAVQAQAENAWLALETGSQRLEALKAARNSSQQAVRANGQALQTGSRNILDLLNSQRHLYRIERDIPLLMADIWLNAFQLYAAMGHLKVNGNGLWQGLVNP